MNLETIMLTSQLDQLAGSGEANVLRRPGNKQASFIIILLLVGLSACCSPELAGQPNQAPAVATYTSAQNGVSFRYPAQFTVKEGGLDKTGDMSLGTLGPLSMAFVQPGGDRIVTVEIPAGSYPQTDFVNAYFSVSIHRHLTAAQCGQFASAETEPSIKVRKISGVDFSGIDESEGAMGHQFGASYYHGFINGQCYELAYGLATAGYGAIDGLKKVDDHAVMARLSAILRTVKIFPPKKPVAARASPTVEESRHAHAIFGELMVLHARC